MSRARKISARLSSHLHSFLDGRINEAALVNKLRRLAKDIEGDGILKVPTKETLADLLVLQPVFDHWQKRMSKPRARLTRGRAAVIKARLRDGYVQDQMKRAIDACCASEWHMGENDRNTAYNDLTMILRSGEKLEQFLAMGDRQGPGTTESPEVRRLLRESADAMERSDTAAYNAANHALKEARN